jgi:metallo-beta-lactamase class B
MSDATARMCTHPWEFRAEAFCIAGNLYYVGNKDVSCHLIDSGDGLILLDSAFPQTVYLLLESIRSLGFDPYKIKYILHTHGHYDHFGGTRALVDLVGAKTFLGEDDIKILKAEQQLSWANEYGVAFYETFEVDVPLAEGTIKLGNTQIRAVHSPGHTDGCMSYFFTVEDQGNEYSVGIHGGPGRNTLTDEYLAAYGRSKDNRDAFFRTLNKLETYDVDIFIGAHPGQNDTFGKHHRKTPEANPFVDSGEWRRFLSGLRS